MKIWRILSRHELARLTRDMRELSQHSLQKQFVHVAEPRKLNEAENKVNFFLIYSVFSAFLCAAFMICL